MGFLDVPNEVILLLIPHLEYEYEINALCRTTRRLYELLNPVLYKHSATQRNEGYMLEWAVIHGSTSTGRLILEAGALPDACGDQLWQPFALAALHGHSEIIKLLYEHGVDPCSTDNNWRNPFYNEEDLQSWEEGHPLSMAALSGHVSVVNLLLKYGVRPDLPTGDHDKQTALHLAAEKGHLDIVRVLTDAGSPINAQDGNGATPLAFAARAGHMDIVKFLLCCGADPNITTENQGTSLCMASCSGNIDIVRCLLDHGATPNPSYPDGQKPLFQLCRAAEEEHDDILDLLLSRFDYVQSSTEPYQQAILLCVAALTGRTTLLTDLLTKHNYDPDLSITDGCIFAPYKSYFPAPKTALAWAAERNQLAAIDILLSHGACICTPPIDEFTPLLYAIEKGHKEAITSLLAHGANPNNPPGKALSRAITKPPIFSLLLSYNADPTIPFHNSNILIPTLYSGNPETLRILLDHPKAADLLADSMSVKSSHIKPQWSPLLRPAFWGGEGVLRLLLDRNLLTLPEEFHALAVGDYLAMAAREGGIPLVRLLLDLRFGVHTSDDAECLVNRGSAKEDPEGWLDFLLENGCSIDDMDWEGRTALFLAAHKGDEDGIRRLLDRGADLLVVCQGETVLSVAARERHIHAVQLILGVFHERGFDLGEVDWMLQQAEEHALENDQPDIVRVLHRFYWRLRYPVVAMSLGWAK
ncbi:unnamed protein product [Penicillium glandicola]